jgi:hypothetical protein
VNAPRPDAPDTATSSSRRIPLVLLAIGFGLVIAASALPWATEILPPPTIGLLIGSRTRIGISSADPIAQFAYYLIWLVVFATVLAMIVDARRRSAWFGAAAGAIATQILLILPVQLHPLALMPQRDPVTTAEAVVRVERGPGSYLVIVAVIVVVAALIAAMGSRRPTARPPAAVIGLIGTYVIVAIADRFPWVRATDTQLTISGGLFAPGATFGPADLFGPAEAAYHLVWLAFFVAAGALICSERPRRMLFGAAGGAILAQVSVVAGMLYFPRAFYTTVLIRVQYPTVRLTTGAFLIMFGLVAASATLAFTVGDRAWPRHIRRPIGAVVIVAGVGLAGAAQVTPWAESYAAALWYGTPHLTIATGTGVPAVAFVLAWLITLVAAGATVLAVGRWRSLPPGAAAGGIATLLFIVIPFLWRPGATMPLLLAGSDRTAPAWGGGLELWAILVVAIGVGISAYSEFRPSRSARRRTPIGPLALAMLGTILAVTAQSMHWFRLSRVYASRAQHFPASVAIWASGSPARYYAPMIAGWIVTFTAVGVAVLADGRTSDRTRRLLIRIAAVALVVEAAAMTTFLIHPALPAALSMWVGPLAVVSEHIDYAGGTYLAFAAVLVFAACLVLAESARRRPDRVRRPDPVAVQPSTEV